MLEERYRIRLPDKLVSGRGVDIPKRNETGVKMDEQELIALADAANAPAGETLTRVRWIDSQRATAMTERDGLRGEVTRLTSEVTRLNERNAELTTLADDGKTYRADLLKEEDLT